MTREIFICIFLFFLCFGTTGQTTRHISGRITDSETGNPLPFASISIKNHYLGTISNEDGYFDFSYPEKLEKDTLQVSFLGYEIFTTKLSKIKKDVEIELIAKTVVLDEINVSPLTPQDYIKRAVIYAKDNFAAEPYQLIGYYNEDFAENNNFVHKKEAVFKSYCRGFDDTLKNQHQLLLYRKFDDMKDLQFMKKWIEKKEKKAKRKEEKKKRKGKTTEEKTEVTKPDNSKSDEEKSAGKDENDEGVTISFSSDTQDMDGLPFGGPETVLAFDIVKQKESFMDTLEMKKFRYEFGDLSYYEGRKIQEIKIRSKRKVDHMRARGNVFIDIENFAIVKFEFNGEFVIPLWVRPILFSFGLKVVKPVFEEKIVYNNINGKYYPKNIHWDLSAKLTKRYIFSKNEHADISIGQVYVVNKIKVEDVIEIPEEKRFDHKKKMSEQINNDENLDWKNVNRIRF